MTIWLNGERAETRGAATVPDLLQAFGLPVEAVLVEYNGVALRPRELPATMLAEGDRLEVIRIVAGG